MIIDSHCHVAEIWYEPVEVLLAQMDRNGVDGAVLVQMGGEYDNDYQAACVRRHPDRLASVVIVDVAAADASATLAEFAAAGATGVRLGPAVRSPGSDPLAVWRRAAELGLAVSCNGSPAAFADPAFAALVQELPSLPVVVEHLGGAKGADEDTAAERAAVFGLSRFANVYLKFHGFGEFCQRLMPAAHPFPFDRAALVVLDEALAAFGPQRMMWGSDYPPVSGREGYANSLRLPREYLSGRGAGADDIAALFGGTARRVFRVGGQR